MRFRFGSSWNRNRTLSYGSIKIEPEPEPNRNYGSVPVLTRTAAALERNISKMKLNIGGIGLELAVEMASVFWPGRV